MSSEAYSFSSYSTSSSTIDDSGVRRTGSAHQSMAHSDPSGTKIQTTSQNVGEPPVQETRYYDARGNVVGEEIGGAQQGRVEEVGDEEPQGRIEDVGEGQDEK